jgi:hypothetical protein
MACPDAAMLAAFHERMLSSEEMNVAKGHIATCSQCQEIVALLEATDEIAVDAEAENVLAMGEPARAGSAGYQDKNLAEAPSAMVAGQPAGALKAPRNIPRGRSAVTWRWVAPAGAIAAGLVIWVATHGSKPQTLTPVAKIQVAEERPAETATATAPGPTTPTKRLDDYRGNENRMKRPAEGFGARHAPEGALGGMMAGQSGAMQRERRGESSSGAAQSKVAENIAKNDEIPAATAPVPTNAAEEGTYKKSVDSPVMTRNTARNSLNKEKLEASTEVARREQPGAPSSEDVKAAAKPSVGAAPHKERLLGMASEQVTGIANEEGKNPTSKDSAAYSRLIPAPGGTVLWRIGRAGKIEQSLDSGMTWSRQSSSVMFDLLAGSAPSEAVCWLVGRRGTILRTTDGGGHWARVGSPIADDVAEIQAVDAMHATVFETNKRASFATSDGGLTWSPAKE